jgi:signal transduction histidine kinase
VDVPAWRGCDDPGMTDSAPWRTAVGTVPGSRRPAPRTATRSSRGRAPALPDAAQWGLLAAFVLFVGLGLALRLPHSPLQSCLAAAVALGCGFALLRVPARWGVPVMVAATAGVAGLGNAASSNVGWFSVCVLACWAALTAPRPHTLAYLGGALALFGAEALWAERDPGWAAWATGTIFTVVAGLLIRHNLDLVDRLRTAQAGLADRTRDEERNRIARELHDVIGHSLTVVALNVASARMSVKYEPADAERALLEAERLVQQTLDEVRSTVGLLRVNDERTTPATAPLPKLTDVKTLVSQSRQAGSDIRCTLRGDLGLPPATVGLAAYRIVQEALTNAAKHAPGVPVELSLTVERGAVDLVVTNTRPTGAFPPGGEPGIGTLSMQERAEAVGGTLSVGASGAAWEVRAALPLQQPRGTRAVP